MKALISDIHGNFEALKAVFEDIDAHKAEEVYFLGDVVGYGPEPEACIDMLEKRCSVFLMGNHDHAILSAPVGFNPIAEEAIWCLKARMEPGIYSMPWKHRRWNFLGTLRTLYLEEGRMFVHGSPRDPISEYIMTTDPLYNPEKVESIFERMEQLLFCGHTHQPGVITDSAMTFVTPHEIGNAYTFTGEKAIINIGSVGQPRDGNPMACYALLDDDRILWRRIPYDIESTIQKISKIDCLHPRNGNRLLDGR
ncbi:MAG: metallophosphoesterase [Planctomycetota bacterium]